MSDKTILTLFQQLGND